MTLAIHLLGGFRVSAGGLPLAAAYPADLVKTWGYLLLFHQRPIGRERLAFLLWPDCSESEARAALRRSLHRLRRALPPAELHAPWLLEEKRTLCWNPAADYWLDVEAFQRGAADASLALYAGDLLPEIQDDWLQAERARLRLLYWEKLEQAAAHSLAAGNLHAAAAFASKRYRAEPQSQAALRRWMQARYYSGDRAGALQALQDYLTGPGKGTTAAAETLALKAAITQGGELPAPWGLPRQPEGDAPPPAAPPRMEETLPARGRRGWQAARRPVWLAALLLLFLLSAAAWHFRIFHPQKSLTLRGVRYNETTWITSDSLEGSNAAQRNAPLRWVDLHDGRGLVNPGVDVHLYPLARINLAGSSVIDALMRFDLSPLAAGSRVERASLAVYFDPDARWADLNRLPPVSVAVYRLLRPWDVETAAFDYPWAEPGLRPGVDYAAQPLAEQTVSGAGYVTFELGAAFPAWQQGGNFGVVFMVTEAPGGSSPYWLATAYHPNPAWHPTLEIQYK